MTDTPNVVTECEIPNTIALTSDPFISVWATKFCDGLVQGRDDVTRGEHVRLSDALTRVWPSDAHTCSYAWSHPYRLNESMVGEPFEIDGEAFDRADAEAVVMWLDLDPPSHDKTPEWLAATKEKIVRLNAAHPGLYAYETKNGLRAVYALQGWSLQSREDVDHWQRYVLSTFGYFKRQFGLECDYHLSHRAWFLRLPRVVRDRAVFEPPWTFGDPRAIAVWNRSTEEQDASDGAELKASQLRTSQGGEPRAKALPLTSKATANGLPERLVPFARKVAGALENMGDCRGRRDGMWALLGAIADNHVPGEHVPAFELEVRRRAGWDLVRPVQQRDAERAVEAKRQGDKSHCAFPKLRELGWTDVIKVLDDENDRHLDRMRKQKATANDTAQPANDEDDGTFWGGTMFPRIDWTKDVPPLEWTIEGIIPEGSVCMLYGLPGSHKSWMAYAMALAVSAGDPLLGKFRTKQCNAAVLDWESGETKFRWRVKFLGINAPDLGYRFEDRVLTDAKLWEDLGRSGVRFLVIDSLFAGSGGIEDERDPRAASALLLAGKFAEAFNATVVFIHHANKEGGYRGTTAFAGACEAMYSFEETGKYTSRVKCTKMSDGHKPDEFKIETVDGTGLHLVDAAEPKADEGTKNVNTRASILLHLRNGSLSGKALYASVGGNKTSFDRELAILVGEDLVLHTGKAAKSQYALDDDAKREARVFAVVDSKGIFKLATETKLAAHAKVSLEFVQAMSRDCKIHLVSDLRGTSWARGKEWEAA